jgi:hypothetical protein
MNCQFDCCGGNGAVDREASDIGSTDEHPARVPCSKEMNSSVLERMIAAKVKEGRGPEDPRLEVGHFLVANW